MVMARAEKVQRSVNSRVSRLRSKALCLPQLCVERGNLMTQSYRETEGEVPVIRRAKAVKKILQEMTISIGDEELIVGKPTTKQRGAALVPEVQWKWYLDEMDTISSRDLDRFGPLSEEEKAKMREFLPYWKGKALVDMWYAMLPPDLTRLKGIIGSTVSSASSNWHIAHCCPDNERVVREGLRGVESQVDDALAKLDLARLGDLEKYHFLTAVKMTLVAAVTFAERYADLAAAMADKESDVQRRAELLKIAETCRRVPANPATTFYEALQSIWLVHVVLLIEGWGIGMNFGRADQYLYPLYKKDLELGRLTRDEARELIALLFIKTNEWVGAASTESVRMIGGFPQHENFTLGGLTRDGRDAVNDLSYLFLEAEQEVALSAEDIVVRVHKNTPDAFLMKACETAKELRGKLKFLSDETTIQQLLSDGKPIEYARDYIISGCNDPTVAGVSQDIPGHKLNIALMLELALNDGRSRLTGEQIGPRTGDPRKLTSYEDVWNAYKRQVEAALPVLITFRNADRKLFAEFAPTPFQSALYQGCIEKGLDITAGGTAPHMTQYMAFSGAPDVGDSLAAIRKVVFEERKVTMDRLIDALDKNFEGEEEILHLLQNAPKFGNDDDYVDCIVNDVLVHGSQESAKYPGFAGLASTACAGIVTGNIPMGQRVGATPDGRRAREPLSEGGISPHQGRNVRGPTATLRSVAKIDHLKLTGGSVLNMRFNPDAMKDESKMRKFASLIRTFCETGGALVQFNIISSETLREAQRYPEKYRDLLVRVATYSSFFVGLSPELQNDIIARMEFEEG